MRSSAERSISRATALIWSLPSMSFLLKKKTLRLRLRRRSARLRICEGAKVGRCDFLTYSSPQLLTSSMFPRHLSHHAANRNHQGRQNRSRDKQRHRRPLEQRRNLRQVLGVHVTADQAGEQV